MYLNVNVSFFFLNRERTSFVLDASFLFPFYVVLTHFQCILQFFVWTHSNTMKPTRMNSNKKCENVKKESDNETEDEDGKENERMRRQQINVKIRKKQWQKPFHGMNWKTLIAFVEFVRMSTLNFSRLFDWFSCSLAFFRFTKVSWPFFNVVCLVNFCFLRFSFWRNLAVLP